MTRARAFLPPIAIVVFGATTLAILASAGATLGYDYQAYVQAAQRLLDGQPLYDPAVDVAGGFAIFLYPPPFAVAFVPFALLGSAGLWVWTGLLVACVIGAIALMPVSTTIRWGILLLAGLDWPVLYSLKLGQVGPILLLLFVLGWRWLDDPMRLGASAAVGTAIKLQPAMIFVWAMLTRRWLAVVVGAVVLAGMAVLATILAGVGVWSDFATLVRQVGDPITTPHNFTPGAIAYQLGAPSEVSWVHPAGQHGPGPWRGRRRGADGHGGGVLSRRGHRQPTPVPGPVGPLRDAPAPAGRVPVRGRALVGPPDPAGHSHPARWDHPADRLPAGLLRGARSYGRGRDPGP